MIVIPLILSLQAAPATGPALSLEQTTALRCAVAFALTAEGQVRGDAAATALPPLAERGREYFVRVSARLMDDPGLSREQVSAAAHEQARTLVTSGETPQVARACLPLLDVAGL